MAIESDKRTLPSTSLRLPGWSCIVPSNRGSPVTPVRRTGAEWAGRTQAQKRQPNSGPGSGCFSSYHSSHVWRAGSNSTSPVPSAGRPTLLGNDPSLVCGVAQLLVCQQTGRWWPPLPYGYSTEGCDRVLSRTSTDRTRIARLRSVIARPLMDLKYNLFHD